MYSGTTLTKLSGRVMGAHQKIDRVAHKKLSKLIPNTEFPKIRTILQFEGKNGPDAIKRKSPSHDEPWHFFNPFDNDDVQLLNLITDHYVMLVKEIKAGNQERVAFEAAWLAHALVDGLTPAHHYPYEEGINKLSSGSKHTERTTVKKKIVMPGSTPREQVINNWKAWGPRGLRTAHGLFEIGVAALIAPLKFGEVKVTEREISKLQKEGLETWFRHVAREVAVLDMYHTYCAKGWTPKLAWQVRHRLGPILVQSVTLVWHKAVLDAGAHNK